MPSVRNCSKAGTGNGSAGSSPRSAITGIEVAPFTLAPRITDLSAERRQTLRRQAADHGLQIIGLHWLLAKTTGLHLTSPDACRPAGHGRLSDRAGHACADLGGDILVFGSPAQRSLEPGDDRVPRGSSGPPKSCGRACPALADRGVKLCLEPLTPKETNFLNTCADAIELIDRVGSPHLVLQQDVKAMLSEATPIPELIVRYSHRVGSLPRQRQQPARSGNGSDRFHSHSSAARVATRYAGWVSVEVFDYSPGCERIARGSIAQTCARCWRLCLDDAYRPAAPGGVEKRHATARIRCERRACEFLRSFFQNFFRRRIASRRTRRTHARSCCAFCAANRDEFSRVSKNAGFSE